MFTENLLLDNYFGITNGVFYISKIDDTMIYWDYRRGDNGDGYNPTRGKREDSTEIYIHNSAEIIPLDESCVDHPSLHQIYADYGNLVI